jgi:aminocarboxymuconate-semialdehyde decarboxylase
MIIEWHTHVYPPEEAAADALAWEAKGAPAWDGKCPMTIENVMNAHDRSGISLSVISNAAHYLRGRSSAESLKAVQRWSDYAAELQSDNKGKLVAFATILPCDGRAQIKEAERAITQLGLRGIFIHSNHNGRYPDEDAARPFWELAQSLDVPIFIHPPHVGIGEDKVNIYRLASSVGRPADLCVALSRLIVRGVLEDFPNIKLVASHGGGGICEVIGRMNYAYELQDECYFLGSYEPMKIRHEPLHYLKKMYFDTATYHAPATRLVLDTVGAEHAVYGSDAPPLTTLKPRAIKLIEDLDIPAAQKEQLFWKTAASLLKLSASELEALRRTRQ